MAALADEQDFPFRQVSKRSRHLGVRSVSTVTGGKWPEAAVLLLQGLLR